MAGSSKTVLLCDDDRLVLATVSASLRSAGFSVVEADNGDDAILLARQHRPDLAVLDMRMHGKSGLDVAAYLRDYIGTPFIFLSAFSDEEIVRQAMSFGALEYLVKPAEGRRIVEAVNGALARHERQLGNADSLPVGEPVAIGASAVPPSDTAVAVGMLMERFGVGRSAAEERLRMLATQRGRAIDQVARDMVAWFEAGLSLGRSEPGPTA